MCTNFEFAIDASLSKKLEKMKTSMNAETYGDLINTAISLLELVVDGHQEGKSVALVDVTNKTYEKINLTQLSAQ